MFRRTGLLVISVGVALAFGAGAAEAAVDAHGSARQVYVTGLAPKAKASLLRRGGKKVATKRADGLGGLLFRNVKPGRGYRVRLAKGGAASPRLTVLSARAPPPSRKF